MRTGLHLPQVSSDESQIDRERALGFIDEAIQVGFLLLGTNDNLVFPSEASGPQQPLSDGPSLLALAAGRAPASAELEAVGLALLLYRGAGMSARTLATLSHLFDGRMTAVLAPGLSAIGRRLADIEEGGVWPRLKTVPGLLGQLLGRPPAAGDRVLTPSFVPQELEEAVVAVGQLRSSSAQFDAPSVLLASGGSPASFRRVALCADGWLALAYALAVQDFAGRRSELLEAVERVGRDPLTVQCGVATAFIHVADSEAEALRIVDDRLAPKFFKDPEVLRGRYARAGAVARPRIRRRRGRCTPPLASGIYNRPTRTHRGGHGGLCWKN